MGGIILLLPVFLTHIDFSHRHEILTFHCMLYLGFPGLQVSNHFVRIVSESLADDPWLVCLPTLVAIPSAVIKYGCMRFLTALIDLLSEVIKFIVPSKPFTELSSDRKRQTPG